MSKLRNFWKKAKAFFYSSSGLAMLVVAEFAHGEGIGAIGRRAANEADGLGQGAQAFFALAGLVMVIATLRATSGRATTTMAT